jgi:hypothetical protein
MADTSSDLSPFQLQLSTLASQIRSNDTQDAWGQVEASARELADGLRNRDGPGELFNTSSPRLLNVLLVDNHTLLGKTDLPQTIADLVKLATPNASTPGPSRAAPVLELLRVGANLTPDHGA